jgi:hypothetical protein
LPVDHTYIESGDIQGTKGSLVLAVLEPNVPLNEALKHPELRDTVNVKIMPKVLAQLKRLGITDFEAHFKGRSIKVFGKTTSTIYLCFPAIAVSTVIVERIEDIEVMQDVPVVNRAVKE